MRLLTWCWPTSRRQKLTARKAEAQDKEIREENEQAAARRTETALERDSIEFFI
jgi:hypothetical protein